MTLLWHIAKKDLRQLRWLLVGWVLLTVSEAVLRAVGPLFIDVTSNQPWYTLDGITNFVPVIRGFLYFIIVALLVLDDPLVGTEAFWLTRPIPRRTLFLSKLFVGALILVVPSLLTEIGVMLGFRVPPMEIAAVVPDILLGSIVLLVCIVFAATLAGTLTQFILGVIGVIITAWIGMAVIVMVMVTRMTDYEPPMPSRTSDPTIEVLLLALMLILFAWTTWYHYRTRRRGRSLLFAIAGVGLIWVLAAVMPPIAWFYGGPPRLPAAMQDPKVTSLRLTRPIRHVFDEQSRSFEGARHRRIAAPLVLDGVLDGYVPDAFTVRATVRMPGGAVVQSKRSQPMIVDAATGHARPGTGLFLSDSRAARSRKAAAIVETWPVLFRAPIDQVRQAGDEPGEYEGTFLYDFTRVEPLTTTALRREMQFFDGPRSLTVWVLGDRGGACSVLVRRTSLQRRGWSIDQPALSESFQDRARGQGTTFYTTRAMNRGLQFGGWSTNSESGQWFHITYQVVDVMPEGQIHGAPAPETLSCADLDIVLQRHAYAGRLVRTLTLSGFHLQAQPGDLTGDESQIPW